MLWYQKFEKKINFWYQSFDYFFGKSHQICDLRIQIFWIFEIRNSYICISKILNFPQRFMKSQKNYKLRFLKSVFSTFFEILHKFFGTFFMADFQIFFLIFWIFCGNPRNRWKNLLVHSADQEKFRTFPPVANGRSSGARIFWRKCWRLSKN